MNVKEEESLFKRLEEMNLPIKIQRKDKPKRVIKIPGWTKTLIEIAIKLRKSKNSKINDQNDEELIRDILKEVEKLGKK